MMKTTTVARAVSSLLLGYLFTLPALAQEGHPMTGVWVGDWGPSAQERNRVVIVMEWTGTELAGTINPGPNAIPFKSATVDPADWRLQAEAEVTNREGRPATYTIDGVLDDLGTYNRSIEGSWITGNVSGTFSITRQ